MLNLKKLIINYNPKKKEEALRDLQSFFFFRPKMFWINCTPANNNLLYKLAFNVKMAFFEFGSEIADCFVTLKINQKK